MNLLPSRLERLAAIASFCVCAAWLAGAPCHAQFTIEIPVNDNYDPAMKINAFERIAIQINASKTGDAESEETISPSWRADFPAFEASKIKLLSWKIMASDDTKPFKFALWPLEMAGPVTSPFKGFVLRTYDDLHWDKVQAIHAIITSKGDLATAETVYDEFVKIYDRVPAVPLDDKGRNSLQLKYTLLKSMIEAADKTRSKQEWKVHPTAAREQWIGTETAWGLKLVLINEDQTDEIALLEMTEAAYTWWNLAITHDLSQYKDWRSELPASEKAFADAAHAEEFRQQLDQVLGCLLDEDVSNALSTKVNHALKQKLSTDLHDQLELWGPFAKKDPNAPKAQTLGDIENLLHGLYTVYR